MINKRVRKLFLGTLVISTALAFSGCDNVKENLEKGITYVNNGEYDKAKKALDEVLSEDPSNNKAKVLEEIINYYKSAQEEYNNGEYSKAKSEIDKVPSEYSNYKIKETIDKLKEDINAKIAEIKKTDDKLDSISNLIKKGKVEEAKKEIEGLGENLTKEQKEKLDSIKKELKDKENKIKEEKIKKEEAEKKAKEKKKIEEEKQKEAKQKAEAQKKKETTNVAKGDILYRNTNLGIQMKLPRSWEGNYRITSDSTSINVFTKCDELVGNGEGYLFSIEKASTVDDPSVFDGVGSKRFVTAKGVKYMIGGPTGMMMSENNPKFKLYCKMVQDSYRITSSINPIN